jgi:hypothetical protein
MKRKRDINVWYGKIEDAPKYPDVAYWRKQSVRKKFEAAWQMVIEAHRMKGEDLSESRLQRSVVSFQPVPR